MSLLLEALKKAEKAKEDAQRRAQGEASQSDLKVEGEATADATPVLTRDKLPDIRQPLEIVSDDVETRATPSPGSRPAPRLEPTLEPAEPAPTAKRPAPRPAGDSQASDREAQRNAGRKVFEAKFKEPNPKLPFYITLACLGVFAVGTVIYFWIQLRPPAPLVNLNPKPAPVAPGSEPTQVAAVPQKSIGAPAPAAPAQAVIPGLPSTPAPAGPLTSTAPGAAKPASRPVPPPEREVEVPRLKPPVRVTTPAGAPTPVTPAPAAEVAATRSAPQVHPKVGSGFAAYQAGDLAQARADYQDALREEPANRDAILGLAAMDVRAGRYEAAEAAYLRLLQSDPRDSYSQAALLALRSGRGDPVAAESRVKTMLADNPGAHVLNFTLGNQLAQQGRWAEAQQQYFKAFSAEPDNADFAYNLAVSLDHLRQPKLALEYYQRAIELAKARGARFDVAAAQSRAAQLGR